MPLGGGARKEIFVGKGIFYVLINSVGMWIFYILGWMGACNCQNSLNCLLKLCTSLYVNYNTLRPPPYKKTKQQPLQPWFRWNLWSFNIQNIEHFPLANQVSLLMWNLSVSFFNLSFEINMSVVLIFLWITKLRHGLSIWVIHLKCFASQLLLKKSWNFYFYYNIYLLIKTLGIIVIQLQIHLPRCFLSTDH